MLRRKTIKRVPVYAEPCDPPMGKILLYLCPGREITLSETVKHLGTHTGKESQFGKSTAGWVLMTSYTGESFFESPMCPVCFCDAEEDPSFKLPCCKNLIHAECFIAQIKSGHFDRESKKARKYDMMHLKCPCCRELYYTRENPNFRWQPEVDAAVRKVSPEFWHEVWEPVINVYKDVDYLISEKERGLPEEEKGGWAIFNCQKCTKMYVPGKMSCAEEMDLNLEEQEYVCPECEWAVEAQDHRCFKHGKKYAIFKCDSCCSIASWDCFYNHYCERCHNDACSEKFYPCPGKGKCPLGMCHPANSKGVHGKNCFGFVIGCYKCGDDSYEPENYNQGAPDPFLIGEQQQQHADWEVMFKYEAKPEEEQKLKDDGLAGIVRPPRPAPRAVPRRRPPPRNRRQPAPRNRRRQPEPIPDVAYQNFVAGFGMEDESDSESIDEEPINAVEWEFLQGFNNSDESESEDESNKEKFVEESAHVEVPAVNLIVKGALLMIVAIPTFMLLPPVYGLLAAIYGILFALSFLIYYCIPKSNGIDMKTSKKIDNVEYCSDEDSELPFAERNFMEGWILEEEEESETSDEDPELPFAERNFMQGWIVEEEEESEFERRHLFGSDTSDTSDSEEETTDSVEVPGFWQERFYDVRGYDRFIAGFRDSPYQNFLNGFASESETETETESELESESEPLWSTEEEDNCDVEQNSLPVIVPRKESSITPPWLEILPVLKSCSQEVEEEVFFEIPAMQVAESY